MKFQEEMHKDDVIRLLLKRGWKKGAGGECYFPEDRRPHLHIRIKSGYHSCNNLTDWFQFLVVSRPTNSEGRKIEGANTTLVKNGSVFRGALSNMGRGEMKKEIESLCQISA